MNQIRILALAFILWAMTMNGQDDKLKNGVGLGMQINQYHNDFGIGLHVTSPYFAGKSIAVRVRGNLMFNEHIKNDSLTVWTPYSNMSIGLIGVGGMIGDFVRLYGEGGTVCLFPSNEFSTASVIFGGYGLFGFEFFMQKYMNYFIEIGGIGTGAVADKVPAKPIYSNGLTITAGFRITL
jgi:hypothetical protein